MAGLSILTERHPRIALVIHKCGQHARGAAFYAFDAAHVADKILAAVALDFSPHFFGKVRYHCFYCNHSLSLWDGGFPLILFEKSDGTIEQV